MADVIVALEDETIVDVAVSFEEGPALTVLVSVEDEPDVPIAVSVIEEVLAVAVQEEGGEEGGPDLDLLLLYNSAKL